MGYLIQLGSWWIYKDGDSPLIRWARDPENNIPGILPTGPPTYPKTT